MELTAGARRAASLSAVLLQRRLQAALQALRRFRAGSNDHTQPRPGPLMLERPMLERESPAIFARTARRPGGDANGEAAGSR